MVLAEAQEDKPKWANAFQASPCVVSANILLAGHIAEPKVKGMEVPPTHQEAKANHVARTNITLVRDLYILPMDVKEEGWEYI